MKGGKPDTASSQAPAATAKNTAATKRRLRETARTDAIRKGKPTPKKGGNSSSNAAAATMVIKATTNSIRLFGTADENVFQC